MKPLQLVVLNSALLVRYSSHDYIHNEANYSLKLYPNFHATRVFRDNPQNIHSTYLYRIVNLNKNLWKQAFPPHCTQTNLTSCIRSSDMELSRSKREVLTLWSLTFLIYAINYSGHRIQQPITKLRILHFHKFRSQTIIYKVITNKQTRRVLLMQTGDRG